MRLRRLLMAAFFAAAAIPSVGAMVWIDRAALTREKDAVQDKHLNMARQLAATADLLVRERMAVLQQYAAIEDFDVEDGGFLQTMIGLGFRHLCLVDPASGAIRHRVDLAGSPTMTPALARRVAAEAGATPRLLPATRDASGRPTLIIVSLRPDGLAAIAALSPTFVADLGRSVAFGERGHAAIVDQLGQALAHPLAEWRRELRNLKSIKPVQAMLTGRDGVVEFRSPAADADMIAGFAVANISGWGAMVVQPVSELHDSAGDFLVTLLTIVAPLTLLFAVVGGWLTARIVARPIERVAAAASRFGAGDQSARAPAPARWPVSETVELGERFNAMAAAVHAHEDSLRASLDQALVADRAKTVFLANMSHELRTPLNAVIGFAEVIATQMLGPLRNGKYVEYAEDIARSGRHLLSLINDVLDISRVEADRIEIDIEDVDVAELMRLASRQIAPQAEAHGLKFTVETPAAATIIQADERRILQILLNLLSNAVRFTPSGGEVRVSAETVGDCMRFVIADTGIGMSVADAQRAVEPFAQPNAALDPSERGVGLGLPLAHNLALLHGGDLVIDSAPGAGCRVTVDIPLRSRAGAAALAA